MSAPCILLNNGTKLNSRNTALDAFILHPRHALLLDPRSSSSLHRKHDCKLKYTLPGNLSTGPTCIRVGPLVPRSSGEAVVAGWPAGVDDAKYDWGEMVRVLIISQLMSVQSNHHYRPLALISCYCVFSLPLPKTQHQVIHLHTALCNLSACPPTLSLIIKPPQNS